MSVANLQGLKAQMVVRPTTAKPTYASEEERLAATHAAQERAQANIARELALKKPLPKHPKYTVEDFSGMSEDDRLFFYLEFGIFREVIPGTGFYGQGMTDGDFLREVESNRLYFVPARTRYLNQDFSEWVSGSRTEEDSRYYLTWWEEPLPEPNVYVGNYNPDTGVLFQEKHFKALEKPKKATVEPKPEASPQVTADKIMLRMPAGVPFNRENLRMYYRTMALRYHPDKNPGKDTTEMFRKVQAAYERLLLEASE